MPMLGGKNAVQHDTQIAAGRIFHAGRHIDAADRQPMLLIFNGTGADSHIESRSAR
jgi:hypothetical protein